MPAVSSSLIGPALEQVAVLPAGDRELPAAGHLGLLEHLARVPDSRKRRGVRHSLSSVLAAAIAAVMAGARSFTAIGEWIADAPPSVLASFGIRRLPLTRRFEPPGEATIRRALESVDAGALDKEVGAWLRDRVHAAYSACGVRRSRWRAAACCDTCWLVAAMSLAASSAGTAVFASMP